MRCRFRLRNRYYFASVSYIRPDNRTYVCQNIRANSVKILVNIPICISQNSDSLPVQIFVTFLIIRLAVGRIMLTSVNFDGYLCLGAIEIDDIPSDDFLLVDCYREIFQKIIPQVTFFRGHVFSQVLCIAGQLFVICFVHCDFLIQHLLNDLSQLTPHPS